MQNKLLGIIFTVIGVIACTVWVLTGELPTLQKQNNKPPNVKHQYYVEQILHDNGVKIRKYDITTNRGPNVSCYFIDNTFNGEEWLVIDGTAIPIVAPSVKIKEQ